VTFAGLAAGTAIAMTFLAKVVGEDAAAALVTCAIVVGLAEAKTSAGAPCVIWVARPELDPKLNTTRVPGWARWNWRPSVVNDSLSDAAAKTVIVPEGAVDPALDVDAAAPSLLGEPHPARARQTTVAVTAVTRRRRICCS